MSTKELMEVRRNEVAMVFQHFGLLPHRRVMDNVAFGLEIRGEDKDKRYERSQKVIELVGLKGYENHYPDQLSGGMQQRVGLARALAVGPKLLLFDEPFSALDPLIRRDMQNEVIRLQEDLDTTMVFITHDLQEALKLGDRILIMRDGEVVQIGRPDEVIGSPADAYIRDFVQRGAPLPRPHAALGDAAAASRGQPGRSRDGRRHGGAERGAGAALDSDHPVRVTENGELVGVVDDEAILRVVVAEEEAPGQGQVMTAVVEREDAGRTRPRSTAAAASPRQGFAARLDGAGVAGGVDASARSPSRARPRWSSGAPTRSGVQNWLADRANDVVLSSGQRRRLLHALDRGRARRHHRVARSFMISTPAFPSPYPEIGFLGVLAIAWFVTALVAGWRMSMLTGRVLRAVLAARLLQATAWTC